MHWLCVVLSCLLLLATPASRASQTNELTIITSSSIPPYVIPEENSGIVMEIMQRALEHEGYSVNFAYAPNKRVARELETKSVSDAFNIANGTFSSLYRSDSLVEYTNIAVSMASANLSIDSLNDLIGLEVYSFQNASRFLGEAFAQLNAAHPEGFHEVKNQESQLYLLFSGRADAIILDRRIFQYYLNKLRAAGRADEGFVIHPIFPAIPKYVVFHDSGHRDALNAGLETVKREGQYQAIVDSYIDSVSR